MKMVDSRVFVVSLNEIIFEKNHLSVFFLLLGCILIFIQFFYRAYLSWNACEICLEKDTIFLQYANATRGRESNRRRRIETEFQIWSSISVWFKIQR